MSYPWALYCGGNNRVRVCVCSAEGNQSSDLMYYSTTSKSLRFNPLYRMDITNRHTTGMCVCVRVCCANTECVFMWCM